MGVGKDQSAYSSMLLWTMKAGRYQYDSPATELLKNVQHSHHKSLPVLSDSHCLSFLSILPVMVPQSLFMRFPIKILSNFPHTRYMSG